VHALVLCIDITNTPAALIESEERGRRRLSRPLRAKGKR
jgi:hypothetical protein